MTERHTLGLGLLGMTGMVAGEAALVGWVVACFTEAHKAASPLAQSLNAPGSGGPSA